MNRERLTILRDHLASLPDERLDMRSCGVKGGNLTAWAGVSMSSFLAECGTAACIAGWANSLFNPDREGAASPEAAAALGLDGVQEVRLFTPRGYDDRGRYTRSDAVAAVQSMLDNPADDALPVWPTGAA